MAASVTVYELQKDGSVNHREVPPMFPRVSKSRLYIVTNQNTQLHLLHNPEGAAVREKSIFQYGVSTKVLAVTDKTGNEWEVRLLLSPSEMARLSSNFNLMGFLSSCLTLEKYQDSLSALCGHHANPEDKVQDLCRAAAQFFSHSEDSTVNGYCKKLEKILSKKNESCIGQQMMSYMVVGALVALLAADLAFAEGTRDFDYKVQKGKNQEDQTQQIQEMIKVFDVTAELLSVSYQGKRVQIIFRNPCPDNWVSGGKTLVTSGETFVFGLCHKVVSISESESEIQFLQNLQESYNFVSVFHLPAFVEHLLMTSTWREKIELFLKEKDQRKKIIKELSQLAVRFICSESCRQKTFLTEFQKKMLEKWSSVEALLVSDEVVCSFGILVAILAAVTVTSNVGRCSFDEEEENPDQCAQNLEDTNTSDVSENNFSTGSSSTSLHDKLSSNEEIKTKVADKYGGAQADLVNIPDDGVNVESKNDHMGICSVESKNNSANDPETNQGGISGLSKSGEPCAELPEVGTQDIVNQNSDINDKNPGAKNYAPESSPASTEASRDLYSQGSGGSKSLHDSNSDQACRTAQSPRVDAQINVLETQDPSSTNKIFSISFSGEGGIGGTESKTGSPNDPETDQRGISGSSETGEPCAELPDVGTQDIVDQNSNNNDVDKCPGDKDYAHESSPTSPGGEGGRHSQGSGGLDDDDEAWRAAQPPSVGARDNVLKTQDPSSTSSFFIIGFIGLMCLLVVVMLNNVLPQWVSSVLVAIILVLLVLLWQVNQQP